MRTKLYFDNNAWDILFEFNVNINSELPSSEYEILITREAEFEIPGMPAEKREYVDKSMKLSDVKTDIYFGHYNPALPSNEQRVTGYGSLGNNEAGGRYPVLFMRALKVTHFRQLDDPLTVFGLEGTIFGSVFTLSA